MRGMKTKSSMFPYDSIIGLRFGHLTVTTEIESVKNGTRSPARKMVWCRCDCGTIKQIRYTSLTLGTTRGCGCSLAKESGSVSGEDHHLWKGGRYLNYGGYVLLAKSLARKLYPMAVLSTKHTDIFEHTCIMSHHLQREIIKGESIHHKDGNRQNNNLSNLELWSKSHPSGQRIEDKVAWAKELLRLYEPGYLIK